MIYSPSHCDTSLSIVSKTVIVTSPQLSEPDIFAGFGIASQETEMFWGNSLVKIGAVLSSTLIVWIKLVAKPLQSVNV